MLWVILAALLAAGVAGFAYLGRERLGPPGIGLAMLRTTALVSLIMLFFNPARARRVEGGPPTVLLDASLSMSAAGGHWRRALDTALALAPSPAAVLRFGADVTAFDTLPPLGGTTRLTDALRVAVSRGGPVVVVTDGELDDAGTVPPSLLHGTRFVVIPRDAVPNASLVDVSIESRVQRDDSIPVTLQIMTQGGLAARTGVLDVSAGNRRLLSAELPLAEGSGTLRRVVRLRPRSLDVGTHVLTVRLQVPGDSVPGDDARLRVVSVTEQPAIVVINDPADWEGRFLSATIAEVVHAPIRSFARVRPGRWVDSRTQAVTPEAEVRGAVRGAGLVVLRGQRLLEGGASRRPIWRWPEGSDPSSASLTGDWYAGGEIPASPIAGRLGAVSWDSVPPLDGMVPVTPGPTEWTGLNARLGRRGAERPVVIGRDSSGVRSLTTTGGGLWRWAFRGGAAREAYRGLVAGGIDWLLGAAAIRRTAPLSGGEVVARGLPAAFRWGGDSVPDSVEVRIGGNDSSFSALLRFDAGGVAGLDLPPGIYRWTAPRLPGAGGTIAVESYSDEFRMRPAYTPTVVAAGAAFSILEVRPRDRWWWFVLAVMAFVGEWAWRLRRGLP